MERSQSLPPGCFLAGTCFALMGILVALSVRFYLQANNNSLPKRQDREPLVPILLAAANASPLDVGAATASAKWVESLPVRMVGAEIADSEGTSHVKAVDLILAARQLSRGAAIPATASAKDLAAPEVKINPAAASRFAAQESNRDPVTNVSELELKPIQEEPASPPLADDDEHRRQIEQEDRQFLDSLDLAPVNPLPSPARLGIPELEPRKSALSDPESLLPTTLASPDTRESARTEIPTSPATELQMTPAPEGVQPLLDPVLADAVAQSNQAASAVDDDAVQNSEMPPESAEPTDAGLSMSEFAPSAEIPANTDELRQQATEVQSAPAGPVTASIGDTSTDAVNEVQPRDAAPTQEEASGDGAIPARAGSNRGERITGWPLPGSLINELESLRGHNVMIPWIDAVVSGHQLLNQLEFANPQSRPLIEAGSSYAEELSQYAGSLYSSDPILASSLARLALRMQRRYSVWLTVHDVVVSGELPADPSENGAIISLAGSTRIRNTNAQAPQDWLDYVMLDEIENTFSDSKSTSAQRQNLARKVLARVSSTAITSEQSLYAQSLIGEDLGNALRNTATGEFDAGQLLVDLEAFEEGNSATAAPRLNGHFQTCYWSRYRDLQMIAGVLDEEYRAANFHIDVSDALVNRVLPRNMTIYQPVQDRILGAHVVGNSQINNQLSVELIPDEGRVSFRLNSNGNVLSRTRAMASGFVFNNLGNAMVNASKGVSIGPAGVQLLPADVVARSNSRLLNVKSGVDSVPLIGWMARSMAEQQQQKKSRQANLIVEQKLRSEFGSRVDEELQLRVEQGRTWLRDNVVMPLNAMELEPGVVDMRTTQNYASVSYRLAGLDQNAANTVRPATPPGSLAGIQIHESAINNLIGRIGIHGKTFTPGEFMQHLAGMTGRADMQVPAGEHDDVKFQFASFDAVRFDFEEDRVAITLRMRRMQIGRGSIWKNLTVTAWYVPIARGMQVEMLLDESRGVSLHGPNLGMTDQLGARTVFNSLFKPSFSFPLLPVELATSPAAEGLAVSDIVLVDGWAGIAIGGPDGNETAARSANPNGAHNARIFQGRWR